jgi:hypothetical protein
MKRAESRAQPIVTAENSQINALKEDRGCVKWGRHPSNGRGGLLNVPKGAVKGSNDQFACRTASRPLDNKTSGKCLLKLLVAI